MSEWSDMQMNGFLGLIHKIVMFITWPFRRFKFLLAIIAAVLVVMIVVPMCYGIKFTQIPHWYYNILTGSFATQIRQTVSDSVTNAKDKASQKINEKIDGVKQTVQQIVPDMPSAQIRAAEEAKAKGEPVRFTAWNVAKFNKVQYKKPRADKNAEVKIKAPTFAVLKRETKEAQAERELRENEQMADDIYIRPYYKGKLADYYRVRQDLGLTYLNESEKLHGKADVLEPNSLYINGTYVYLYGIYTNPDIYDAAEAQLYLEQLVEGKEVYCDVVAYTTQTQMATALCFVDGVFINGDMVQNSLALDVALK